MKSYTPEKLVAISRYKNYFPTLPEEIQRDVYQRIRTLLMEEKQYCDKGNYKHIAQILTSIALYRSLQAKASQGKLIREYTLATGGPMCDYWIVPDQLKNPQ